MDLDYAVLAVIRKAQISTCCVVDLRNRLRVDKAKLVSWLVPESCEFDCVVNPFAAGVQYVSSR